MQPSHQPSMWPNMSVPSTTLVLSTYPSATLTLTPSSTSASVPSQMMNDHPTHTPALLPTGHPSWSPTTCLQLVPTTAGTAEPTLLLSPTSISCQLAAGYSAALQVTAQLDGIDGTLTGSFVYTPHAAVFSCNAPIVSKMSLLSAPGTTGSILTAHSCNFSFEDTTPLPCIGNSRGATVSSHSEATPICKINDGGGSAHFVALTIGIQVGTVGTQSSYDTPAMSPIVPLNGTHSSGASVTVLGFNFGGTDRTPISIADSALCQTATWVSNPQMVMLPAAGAGSAQPFEVLLYQSIVTVAAVLSCDAPVVTHLAPTSNSPPSGQVCITMQGHNFGKADTSPTAHNSSTLCISMAWTSISLLVCSTPNLEGVVPQSKRSAWVRMLSFGGVIDALFNIDACITGNAEDPISSVSCGPT